MKGLWASVQGDPVFMRRVNGWLTVFWIVMILISIAAGWIQSVAYISALSLWALVSGHWSAWQAAQVEVAQEGVEERVVEHIVQETEIDREISCVRSPELQLALIAAGRRGRLPERVHFGDVATMALATHKIARLLSKDSATSFFRAPFVRLEEKSGTNSVEETPRGRGLQGALGELLSCPECTGQWVAPGLLVGIPAPRTTRAITSLYSALALGDLRHFIYTGLKSRA